MTVKPKKWSRVDLENDAKTSASNFREERLTEPLLLWKIHFRDIRKRVRQLFNEVGLRNPTAIHSTRVIDLYKLKLDDVIRYMAAPPISQDDLSVLSSSKLSVTALRRSPVHPRSVLRTIRQSLDPFRFPWVSAGLKPSAAEWKSAINTSAALMTAQRVATIRRNSGKDEQESAVKLFLQNTMKLKEVKARTIDTFRDAPAIGEFCGESKVAGRKADIVVPLPDGRLLLIECKVSNSATNSVKRVLNDAAAKADKWTQSFGDMLVVPAAVISGVFNTLNLEQAQEKKLTLFWAHRLDDLGAFIESTQPEQR